jgi:hypothetical protein
MVEWILLSRLTPHVEEIMGIIDVDFNAKGQLVFIYPAFVKFLRKNENTLKQCISYL